ncbi:MAG TPA: M1 family metallopeptidase [Flavobacterium sp.]|nr:M1 family metallopeptidase [Flavobacterium sp.]
MKYIFLLIPFFAFSQVKQTQKVDFTKVTAMVSPDFATKSVRGTASYEFEVLSPIDTIRIDAVNMTFTTVYVNGKSAAYKNTSKQLLLFEGFKKGKNDVWFDYTVTPKQTIYFTGTADNYQIWTQGQGKNTSYWLPSFDDTNEKAIFNISVSADKDYVAISNGVLRRKDYRTWPVLWIYKMDKPMSSYLVMLAIGKFTKKTEKAKSGIPLDMYYLPEDEAKFAATYKYSKQIFDFLEMEIGYKYAWQIYKQVPVKDFLYAGMENTSATVFAQDLVVDDIGYNDRNYINVNAHELAHQWFGDLITAKSGKHHWLQEGFATYYALLAEESIFGENHFNMKMYDMAEDLARVSKTDTIPILNEKASSLTFYRKGAWALHVLREGVGHEKFRIAIRNYLKKYAFKNVDTDEFLAEINKVSDYDTKTFKMRWLEKGGFEVNEAIDILKRNNFMKQYFDVLDKNALPFAEKKAAFETIIKSDAYYPVKEEIIMQTESVSFEEKETLIKMAMQSNDIHLRQAVAKALTKIPPAFFSDFATLLDDKSYVTQGIALSALWQQFPEKQSEVLDKTQNHFGFNDKDLRMQWLVLAMMTKDYRNAEKVKFYDELLDYATPKYESSIRQNALENLLYISKTDTNVLPLLVNPLTSFKWQFSKFARDNIRELIKKETVRGFYEKTLLQLPENERIQLKRLLDEK